MKKENTAANEDVKGTLVRDPVRRWLKAVRTMPSKVVSSQARALLYAVTSMLALGRGVDGTEFRVAACELAAWTDMSERTIVSARAELVERGFIVLTRAYDHARHIPPTYRVNFVALEKLSTQKQEDKLGLHAVQTAETNSVCTACRPPSVPRADRGLHPVQSQVDVGSPGLSSPPEKSAATPRAPAALSLQVKEENAETNLTDDAVALVTTEELESPAPPVHLVTTVQEGPTGSPGRLSAGSYSAWVPEAVPAAHVRPKKSPGKKDPKVAPVPLAARAALEVPPALPETSERVAPRPASPVASRPLPVRTQKEAPDAAPAPRTVPPAPTVSVVWSGDASGASPGLSPKERDFSERYRAAAKVVEHAKNGMSKNDWGHIVVGAPVEGEALGDLCAKTFAEHFPRGYEVEFAEWHASRTAAVQLARTAHNAAVARREAQEQQEEARAERAHKKKRSA